MRTADQVKRKYHELASRKQALEALYAEAGEEARPELQAQAERLEDQLLLLEWVLNAPSGSYHG
ncbi:hypothetical protein OMP38_23490 [Cohnella ginsengisoli]|uniref:Uncharacterized protein n=1 Tax=Cohnella ginsengisoli TaxID=425004 RepID=A0A9X4KJN9_9BACL|nr:hypothetical protein [Cohnella ginsengisoli]MDG0793467.1 hypothetical protein [Cohnella ginsengisoli]SFB57968.1 hypothetical protein SAMN05216312_114142 [Cohnella sp. OV330]